MVHFELTQLLLAGFRLAVCLLVSSWLASLCFLLQYKHFYVPAAQCRILLTGRPVVPVLYSSLVVLHVFMVLTWYDMTLENFLVITVVPLVVSMVCAACKLGKTSPGVSHGQRPKLEQVYELKGLPRETFATIQVQNMHQSVLSPDVVERTIQSQKSDEDIPDEQERRCCYG